MLLNFLPFIGNNEEGDIFFFFAKALVESCLQSRSLVKSWSLALPSYRPPVAKATARIFKIAECGESHGRPLPAGDTKDAVDLRGRVGLGVFRQIGHRTTLCFLFKPGGGQNVDSGSDLSSNRIPGPDRSCNAIKIVIEC